MAFESKNAKAILEHALAHTNKVVQDVRPHDLPKPKAKSEQPVDPARSVNDPKFNAFKQEFPPEPAFETASDRHEYNRAIAEKMKLVDKLQAKLENFLIATISKDLDQTAGGVPLEITHTTADHHNPANTETKLRSEITAALNKELTDIAKEPESKAGGKEGLEAMLKIFGDYEASQADLRITITALKEALWPKFAKAQKKARDSFSGLAALGALWNNRSLLPWRMIAGAGRAVKAKTKERQTAADRFGKSLNPEAVANIDYVVEDAMERARAARQNQSREQLAEVENELAALGLRLKDIEKRLPLIKKQRLAMNQAQDGIAADKDAIFSILQTLQAVLTAAQEESARAIEQLLLAAEPVAAFKLYQHLAKARGPGKVGPNYVALAPHSEDVLAEEAAQAVIRLVRKAANDFNPEIETKPVDKLLAAMQAIYQGDGRLRRQVASELQWAAENYFIGDGRKYNALMAVAEKLRFLDKAK